MEQSLCLVDLTALVALVHVVKWVVPDEVVHDNRGGGVVRSVVEGLGVGVQPLGESCLKFFGPGRVECASGTGEVAIGVGGGEVELG